MQPQSYTEYISQHTVDNPLRRQLLPDAELLLAYARASESVNYEEKNQDAYAVRVKPQRGVVVVADGVGQSFHGEIASSWVVQALTDELWKSELTDLRLLSTAVTSRLQAITSDVTHILESINLEQYPVMFRDALQQKRALGSESVFCAAAYDRSTDSAVFCWLGDCRVQVYDHEQRRVELPPEDFVSLERWSSVRRLVGDIRFVRIALSRVRTFSLYSDGLSELDSAALGQPNVIDIVREAIQNNAISPRSDDSTFVRLFFTQS